MTNDGIGYFCGSVLLAEDAWDKEKLVKDLKEDWNIEIPGEDAEDENDDTILTTMSGYRVVISKFPSPIPNQEAEINASNNYMW